MYDGAHPFPSHVAEVDTFSQQIAIWLQATENLWSIDDHHPPQKGSTEVAGSRRDKLPGLQG